MKIAGVDFPEPLLNALRDGRLVIFAGAGVSMGPPAGLPDFRRLAEQVAQGTGQSIYSTETEDRFLGRLEDRGTDVHQRAADILQRNNPEPTALHLNLLRLFGETKDVRTVTTNFDDLFEQAALGQFNPQSRVFQAPTLPLGNRFRGIVHLHGSVIEPEEMVLTHRDFGRAYLTESDGWARRFVIDLFTNYTVLFVGYSHSDTIMTYLTPSLPPNDGQKRFALVGDQSDDPNHWRRMGIEPVAFHQTDANDFRGLDEAVAGLAHFMRRGVLEWQREIAAIASGYPPIGPIDDESAGIIEHALSDPIKTRFFVESAELPEWIDWLDGYGQLAALFTDGELGQRDQTLVSWLVSRFAIAHDSVLFALIARHGRRLNPMLWQQLSWQLQHSIPESPDAAVMTRWVLCLTSTIPAEADEVALSWIAKACASVGATDSLLRVYEAMTAQLNRAPPRLGWRNSDMFHYQMQEMLSECIKPNLPEMAEPLLALTTMRLNSHHAVLTAWDEGDATWHWNNFRRSAIEPHEQDNLNGEVDPLIDTARECLEWLAVNQAGVARLWSERYAGSPVPLLRRLAVHTLSALTDLSDDDKIVWLLKSYDIHEIAAHHEIFRAASIAYPQVGLEQRCALINAVLAYRWPEETEPDKDRYTAYHHLEWLHWLREAAPDCELTRQALANIREQHPEFQPSEHPDFTHYHWSGIESGTQSHWTVDALLARPADEALPLLLEYQITDSRRSDGYSRWGMLSAVEEAVKQKPAWGLDLADSMVNSGRWNSDLWSHVIQAWTATELDEAELIKVLSHLSANELHQAYTNDIAHALCTIARKASDPESEQWLSKANAIAVALQPYAVMAQVPNFTASVGGVPREVDWLQKAINHPCGRLAEFWVQSIALWHRQQETPPQSLDDEYRSALDGIMQDNGVAGQLARTALARYFPFLLRVDETWTGQNLIPLLNPGHSEFVSTWDGLTYCGQMTPPTAELLREPFLKAVERIDRELAGSRQQRFIAKYFGMLAWFATGPTDEWITKLFTHGDAEVSHQLATEVSHRLRSLDDARQKEWWRIWLKGYWENRLLGVPAQLDDTEIETMLEWTTLLPAVYPEAVDLAVQMRAVPLQRGTVIYRIGKDDLVNQYPEAVAKLLIHLGKVDHQPWTWHGAKEIFDELLQSNLESETKVSLRETVAKIGLR